MGEQLAAGEALRRRCLDEMEVTSHKDSGDRDAGTARRRGSEPEEESSVSRGPRPQEIRCGGARQRGMRMLAALILFLGYSTTQVHADAEKGTFRYGHISWAAKGNKVLFTIQAAFRKSVTHKAWSEAKIGDKLILFGKEPPQFLYGDGQFKPVMTMEVTAVSQSQDWVMGVIRLEHTYGNPNNNERPWRAQFVGCCRIDELMNNANIGYELTAEVDLTRASRSPVAASLPIITVPLSGKPPPGAAANAPLPPPSAYIPSRSGGDVEWDVGAPLDVGTVVYLDAATGSFLRLPLAALQSGQTCEQNSTGSRCLVQLLSADRSVWGSTRGGAAISVEGWVKLSKAGYLLSTDHLTSSGSRISTLSVYLNETHVVVGHEREQAGTVQVIHSAFPLPKKEERGAEQDAMPESLMNMWFHLAVVREQTTAPANSNSLCSSFRTNTDTEGAASSSTAARVDCMRTGFGCACPACGPPADVRSETVAYRVYINAQQLFQHGVEKVKIQVMCGPRCNGVSCANVAAAPAAAPASPASLYFGTYNATAGSAAGRTFAGWLDEWRIWNGALHPNSIEQVRKARLREAREPFTGDLTAGLVSKDTYTQLAVVLAAYSMDYICPVASPPGESCEVKSMAPVYPKERVPGRTNFVLEARGHVMTAPPDSQGVMLWQSGVDEQVGVDELGRFTFAPRKGPGTYQVTVMLANRDGSGKVPVDVLVQVLDTAPYDAARKTFALCSGGYSPCRYAGNAFVPRLQILAAVIPNGFLNGYMSRETAATAVGDVTFLAFPCSLSTWSGFRVKLEARAYDEANATNTQVGFVVGSTPPNMHMTLLRADEYGRMLMEWTPCDADIGSHVVCLSAQDSQVGAASAASEQTCVNLRVLEDPPPYFDVSPGKTQVEAVRGTMGKETSLELYAVDANCLDAIEISIRQEDLPPGAVLHTKPPPNLQCTHARSTLTWIPAYDWGGSETDLCFSASDAPRAPTCGKRRNTAKHCVRVIVERCVYAIQPDQQLQEVAAFYQASWMQLWSLNQGMGHPDLVIYASQVMNVGHKYRAGPSETAGAVAKRMGMSVQQLMLLNHDLRDAMAALPKDCEANIYTKTVKVAFSLPMTLTGNVVTGEAVAGWSSGEQASLLKSLMADALKVPPCKVSIQFLNASSRIMMVAGHVTAKDQGEADGMMKVMGAWADTDTEATRRNRASGLIAPKEVTSILTSALKANGMIGRKEVAGIAQMPSVQDAPLVRTGAQDVPLRVGQEVCVIPNSCTGLAATHLSRIQYKDAGSYAQFVTDALAIDAAADASAKAAPPR